MERKKLLITLTTTDNQKNNKDNNTTIIDLSECEKVLRSIYNISNDKKIYLLKIEVEQDKMKIPKIEYDVYYKENETNLIKLNLNYCKNCKANLLIPIEINESLEILNSSSNYYNDICYTTKSDSGTDITLTDRKNDFILKNKTVCQDNCIFADYDKINKKAKCSCEIKEPSSSTANMNIDANKLLKNFIDIKNIANFGILVCYKKLFSLKGFIKNIGCLMIIPIIIFHFICIIIFYCKQFKKLKKKIKNIFIFKDIWRLFKKQKISKHKNNLIKILFKVQQNYLDTSVAQKRKTISTNKNSDNTSKITLNSNIYNNSKENQINLNKNNKGKYNNELKNKNNKNFALEKNHQLKTIIKKIYKLKNGKKIYEKKLAKKINKIIKFNEQELNDLNYNLAIIYDKRSYCKYYFSLIKTKHNLIFSFYYNKDYNSRIIKVDLFFFSFVLDFAVNALFFNDDTMHKIYEEKGKFHFLYQLPQIIYSFFISYIFNIPLNILALPEDDILALKNNKSKRRHLSKQKNLFKKLRIKFALYFIISTVFLFFLWYYISIFCAVYISTQMNLIQDTIISFGISIIYPFIIYLFPGLFRIPSLKDKKKQKAFLYIISKVLQML